MGSTATWCTRRMRGERTRKGVDIDFSAPAFIEDFGVVEAVRESYQGKLTLVSTMLQAAQTKGLSTAAIGKFGAAFIQDYKRGGIILDEDAAMPLSFAKELQKAGYALPRNTVNAYDAGALALANDNGDPTAPIAIQRLNDGQTANPLDRTGALSRRGFTYLTDVFVNYVLPNKKPDLTVFWSKEPDATNHAYGPGTYNSIDATKMNDEFLGRVMDKIRQLGWEQSTDIIITQDHVTARSPVMSPTTRCGELSKAASARMIHMGIRSRASCGRPNCLPGTG